MQSVCLHFFFFFLGGSAYSCIRVDLSVFSLSLLLLIPLFVVNLYSARRMLQYRNALHKSYLLLLLLSLLL